MDEVTFYNFYSYCKHFHNTIIIGIHSGADPGVHKGTKGHKHAIVVVMHGLLYLGSR